jgi:hypothetical protein
MQQGQCKDCTVYAVNPGGVTLNKQRILDP